MRRGSTCRRSLVATAHHRVVAIYRRLHNGLGIEPSARRARSSLVIGDSPMTSLGMLDLEPSPKIFFSAKEGLIGRPASKLPVGSTSARLMRFGAESSKIG